MATANKQGVNIRITNILTAEQFVVTTNASGIASFEDIPKGTYDVELVPVNGYVFSADNSLNAISGAVETDVRKLPYRITVAKNANASSIIVITPNIYELVVEYVPTGYTLKVVRHLNNYMGAATLYIESIVENILPPPSGHPSRSVITFVDGNIESNTVTIDGYSSDVDTLNLKCKLYQAGTPDTIGVKGNDTDVLNLKDYTYTTLF